MFPNTYACTYIYSRSLADLRKGSQMTLFCLPRHILNSVFFAPLDRYFCQIKSESSICMDITLNKRAIFSLNVRCLRTHIEKQPLGHSQNKGRSRYCEMCTTLISYNMKYTTTSYAINMKNILFYLTCEK